MRSSRWSAIFFQFFGCRSSKSVISKKAVRSLTPIFATRSRNWLSYRNKKTKGLDLFDEHKNGCENKEGQFRNYLSSIGLLI